MTEERAYWAAFGPTSSDAWHAGNVAFTVETDEPDSHATDPDEDSDVVDAAQAVEPTKPEEDETE